MPDQPTETRFTTDDFGREKFNRVGQTLANAMWRTGHVLGLVEMEQTFAPASTIWRATTAIDWLVWGRRDSTEP